MNQLRYILNNNIYKTSKWYIDLGYPSVVEKYILIPIDEGLQRILLKDILDFIGIVIDETRDEKDIS